MKKSYFVLHTAVLLAGFTGIFGKLISLNEIPLVWFRVFFSSIILFFVVKKYSLEKLYSFSEIKTVSKPGILIIIHWIFFYASINTPIFQSELYVIVSLVFLLLSLSQ